MGGCGGGWQFLLRLARARLGSGAGEPLWPLHWEGLPCLQRGTEERALLIFISNLFCGRLISPLVSILQVRPLGVRCWGNWNVNKLTSP